MRSIEQAVYQRLIDKKLNSLVGFLILLSFTLSLAYLFSNYGTNAAFLSVGLLFGVVLICIALIDFRKTFFLAFTVSCFFVFIFRAVGHFFSVWLELGMFIDGLVYLTFIGLLFSVMRNKEAARALKNPLAILLVIYLIYLFLQFFNPYMPGKAGWFSFMKRQLSLYMSFFIVLVALHNLKFLKKFIHLWLLLVFITALYGIYQEFIGFTGVENAFLDLVYAQTGKVPFFHGGMMRKFSFFSDPATFGMFMAPSCVFAISLATAPISKGKRFQLIIVAIASFMGMLFSGTRTAYVMFAAGLFLLGLMKIDNIKVLISLVALLVIFAGVLYGPFYGNVYINRLRSSFIGSEDASLSYRDYKRSRTQDYLHSHPFGGGIHTTGVFGMEYNPNHYLSQFLIDSGYLKIGLEQGWIGLVFTLVIYFVALRSGFVTVYRARSRLLSTIAVGAIASIFTIMIAQFPQKTIDQVPLGFLLYGLMAVIAKLRFDLRPRS